MRWSMRSYEPHAPTRSATYDIANMTAEVQIDARLFGGRAKELAQSAGDARFLAGPTWAIEEQVRKVLTGFDLFGRARAASSRNECASFGKARPRERTRPRMRALSSWWYESSLRVRGRYLSSSNMAPHGRMRSGGVRARTRRARSLGSEESRPQDNYLEIETIGSCQPCASWSRPPI